MVSSRLGSFAIEFDGEVLNRGFWLYLIEVTGRTGRHFYVGRTGDSSSANAASPFSRIGRHLDFRDSARGNSLARSLLAAGVVPAESRFRMVAVGPLFPEVESFSEHVGPRDALAALERDVAAELRARGHQVLGKNHSRAPAQASLLASVLSELERKVPRLAHGE